MWCVSALSNKPWAMRDFKPQSRGAKLVLSPPHRWEAPEKTAQGRVLSPDRFRASTLRGSSRASASHLSQELRCFASLLCCRGPPRRTGAVAAPRWPGPCRPAGGTGAAARHDVATDVSQDATDAFVAVGHSEAMCSDSSRSCRTWPSLSEKTGRTAAASEL